MKPTREQCLQWASEADPGFGNGPDSDGTMSDSIVGIAAIEALVLRAKQLNLELDDVRDALAKHWESL